MHNLKLICSTAIIVAILTFGLTRYFFPKVEQKEVIKYQTRTKTRTVIQKDGTTIIEKDEAANYSKLKETTVKPQWNVSASIMAPNFGADQIYGLQVQRRILGPFYVGINANTEQQFGLSLGMEF